MSNRNATGRLTTIKRQTIATSDAEGQLQWFPVAEAQRWTATTLDGSELFRVAGRWVLLEAMGRLCGEPARIVDDDEALWWLTINGHQPPLELGECAERHKLR